MMTMKRTLAVLIALTMLIAPAAAAQNQTQETGLMAPGLVPGDFFYPMEQFVERIEVAVAGAPVVGSNELQAKVRANNAEERLSEARELANRGNNSERVSELMKEYGNQMDLATRGFAKENKTNLSEKMAEISDRHTRVLQGVKQKVPPQAQDAVEKAMDRSRNTRKDLGLPERANRTPQRPDEPGKKKPGKKGKKPEVPEDAKKQGKDDNKTVEPAEKVLDLSNKTGGQEPVKDMQESPGKKNGSTSSRDGEGSGSDVQLKENTSRSTELGNNLSSLS